MKVNKIRCELIVFEYLLEQAICSIVYIFGTSSVAPGSKTSITPLKACWKCSLCPQLRQMCIFKISDYLLAHYFWSTWEIPNYKITPLFLLVFQSIERLVKGDIIPLDGGDLIVPHSSKGIDQMSTETGINVIRLEAPQTRPILGPVGKVACQLVGRTCRLLRIKNNGWLRWYYTVPWLSFLSFLCFLLS